MKKWFGWILLGASLFATYQGWLNSKPNPVLQKRSRATAEAVSEDHKVLGEKPQSMQTDFMGHRYEWKTAKGTVSVACERQYIFLGDWACTKR